MQFYVVNKCDSTVFKSLKKYMNLIWKSILNEDFCRMMNIIIYWFEILKICFDF